MSRGETAAWAKDGSETDEMPPQFDADGKMRIGGV